MIYVAFDNDDLDDSIQLAKIIKHVPCGIKLGMTFFAAHGAAGVRAVHEIAHQPIFLDMKYHDIPATVGKAIEAVCRLPIAIVNIHASGGLAMMKAAVEARDKVNPNVRLIGVTVLTSLEDQDRISLGWAEPTIEAQVLRWAKLAKDAGLDGVVCSPHEIKPIRNACGDRFELVTPGVRPIGADINDQRRVMTPLEAHKVGATHLVIGRPITKAEDPLIAVRDIIAQIS